jgi:diguanylate cyclase (GGDEF)-like protein
LTRVLRAGDVTARLGGDEFLMLVSLDDPRSGPAAARSVAARVRRALEEPVTPESGGADLSIAVSVGVALHPHDADDPEALVRAADAAMYVDKASRRRRAA